MEIEPISHIGAEVRAFGRLTQMTAREKGELIEAFQDKHLLVLRGDIPVDDQIAVCRLFGSAIDEKSNGELSYEMTNRVGVNASRGRLLFHSDHSYAPTPIGGISLYALEVPGDGSTTLFANAERAWQIMPEALHDRLDRCLVCNVLDLDAKGDYGAPACRTHPASHAQRAYHPVGLINPLTGRRVAYINELSSEFVEGMSPSESAEIIETVGRYVYAAENIYEHDWHVGDLVIWDNIALQHARNDPALRGDAPDGGRTFRRVAFTVPDWSAPTMSWYRAYNYRRAVEGKDRTVAHLAARTTPK